jgi:DNA-binding SARP family transcriptional activator
VSGPAPATPAGGGLSIALLGPTEVHGTDGPADQVQQSLRVLLAVLSLSANRVVSSRAIIDALWQEEPSREREQNLHSRVYQLRRLLSAAEPVRSRPRLGTAPPGYRLELAVEELDVTRFRSLTTGGRDLARAGAPDQAARVLDTALALWRGPALADVSHSSHWLQCAAASLEEERLAATEDWAEAMLAAGRHAELTVTLLGLVEQHPLRERLRRLLMVALCLSGDQARALDCYERGRRLLADELGVDPGPDLRRLHAQILRGEVRPLRTPPPAPTAVAGPVPRGCALSGSRLVTAPRHCRR